LCCLNYVNTNLYLSSVNSTRNGTFATILSLNLRPSDFSQSFMHIQRNGTLVLRTAFFWVTTQQLFLKVIDTILKMETIFPETSLRNSHYSLRNNTEECSSHLFRGGSLKSRIFQVSLSLYIAAELGL